MWTYADNATSTWTALLVQVGAGWLPGIQFIRVMHVGWFPNDAAAESDPLGEFESW